MAFLFSSCFASCKTTTVLKESEESQVYCEGTLRPQPPSGHNEGGGCALLCLNWHWIATKRKSWNSHREQYWTEMKAKMKYDCENWPASGFQKYWRENMVCNRATQLLFLTFPSESIYVTTTYLPILATHRIILFVFYVFLLFKLLCLSENVTYINWLKIDKNMWPFWFWMYWSVNLKIVYISIADFEASYFENS